MLHMDAARMARLAGDDQQATAPGTYRISHRIHGDTVGVSPDGRERLPHDEPRHRPARRAVSPVAA
jgi:hypothetical protein